MAQLSLSTSASTPSASQPDRESYAHLYEKLLPAAGDNGGPAETAPAAAASKRKLAKQPKHGPADAPHSTPPKPDRTHPRPAAMEKPASVKELVERRHILKEFVETERNFHNDMMILNNIYKATSERVLSDIDRKTLFGNIEQVCSLSGKLAEQFRVAADPSYAAKRKGQREPMAPASSSSTNSTANPINNNSSSNNNSNNADRHEYPTTPFSDWPEDQLLHYDARTELGQVFSENMSDIHEVYGYYLKNHSWANAKLSDLEHEPGVALWLQECRTSASDLTTAWNLNALLVKPMQRVTKYPLMLRNLIKVTALDHSDRSRLERAIEELEDKLHLWNETPDGNPSRKESDLFPKLVHRRVEKMRQHVGIANSVEDPEYDKLSQRFGGHFFQLQIVMRDVNTHIETLQTNMTHHVAFVTAAEEFCRFDQRPSHPETKSGLATYSRIVNDMSIVGLNWHINAIKQHVLDPLEQLWKLHQGPQEMMRRRKKRSVDYVKWRHLVGRGETPDKKLRDSAEQFKTTNDRLKDELPKLYELSRRLVKVCLDNLIHLQGQWHDNWVRRLDLAARSPNRTDNLVEDLQGITDEYVADFGYVNSRLRELGVCNGSLQALASITEPPISGSSSLMEDALSRGRAGTINSSHKAGSVRSDVDPHRLSATTVGSTLGRSTMDVSSASARSSRGPITPKSISQVVVRPPLSKAPSFGSTLSGRQGQRSAHGQQPSLVRSSSGNEAPPRLSLDLPGGESFNSQALSIEEVHPNPLSIFPTEGYVDPYQTSNGSYAASEMIRSPTNPFSSVMPVDMDDGSGSASAGLADGMSGDGTDDDVSAYKVLFVAASLYEFRVEDTRSFVGFPYLQYTIGEIFDVIGQNGELWMARNQDDPQRRVGWIWERHFARILPEGDDDEEGV